MGEALRPAREELAITATFGVDIENRADFAHKTVSRPDPICMVVEGSFPVDTPTACRFVPPLCANERLQSALDQVPGNFG